jgi:putative ATPase
VGYRYPHAYAEHWVAQRYLPAELQGQVFWQPGTLGWEGQLRQRLQQRRAAQLAAAAETALERPELLSSAPEDPVLERWLQRQAGAEGERLDRLRQRFWQQAELGRLDRVLVLDAHSLLWALDPLQATGEGQVVITLPTEAERQRLEAQLQLLDALRRPQLLLSPARPAELAGLLEPGTRFEWIAARQPLRQLPRRRRQGWMKALSALAAPGARGRWLQSRPLQGPAGCLLSALRRGALPAPDQALLESLLPLEQGWLAADTASLGNELEAEGWSVEAEVWQETLELRLDDAVLRRWFAPGAAYAQRLEAALPPADRAALERLFQQQRGITLPQPMGHELLRSHRP